MIAIPFSCVAPADEAASDRRRRLRQRMRVAAIAAALATIALAAIVAYGYVASGVLTAAGLLFVGCITLLEAFRQADRRFIAPLEARCQDDYNRQIDVLLGPLFQSGAQRRIELPERTDA
jgi:hypothetical protein